MATAKVFRPPRSWKGPAKFEDFPLGDVTGVVIGGPAPQAIPRFPGLVNTEGMIGIPFQQDSGITVDRGDYLDINDDIYLVTGPRQWTNASTLTGTAPSLYWCEVQSSH